jgi:hypothetical protein
MENNIETKCKEILKEDGEYCCPDLLNKLSNKSDPEKLEFINNIAIHNLCNITTHFWDTIIKLFDIPNIQTIIGNINTFTESSGRSFLIIGEENVLQYYSNQIIKNNICKMYQKIYENKNFNYEGEIYDLFDYIVPISLASCETSNNPMNNIIIWKRMIPAMAKKKNGTIDYNQLKNDITIALNGLHSIGYVHGDSTVDNIGYYNGKYILYDFDMSSETKNIEMQDQDFKKLYQSIEFNKKN